MDVFNHYSLKHSNSFNVEAITPALYHLNSLEDCYALPDLSSEQFYILGDGTNTLFVDDVAPIIIKPDFKGISVKETDNSYLVTVSAGENWHNLVCYCIDRGILGLENLALIPGSVGAAPVQNIGAYGVEFSDFCLNVKWFDFSRREVITLSNNDCDFAYRNSIFKNDLKNRGVIYEVVFRFPKLWSPNLSYSGLDKLGMNVTAQRVMQEVVKLRTLKLPDPKLIPNAGSFFKNPIVDKQVYTKLSTLHSNVPFYEQGNDKVKLAAGWLIDNVGLKGYQKFGVGVHRNQALVLVNYSSNQGRVLVELAQYIQQRVLVKFGILLSPEVRMITAKGQKNIEEIILTNGNRHNG